MSSDQRVQVLAIDDDGVLLSASADLPLDVSFDGRRVLSLWTHRDTDRARGRGRRYVWPDALRSFLNGTTTLSVHVHGESTPVYVGEVSLGSGSGQIVVADKAGKPLVLDKSQRLASAFSGRTPEQVAPLVGSIRTVIDALEAAGVAPFLAYGTLLGAVREGDFIGHDSDADLGYVSAYEHPVDVIGESFAFQRTLHRMGFPITRYSGIAFKIGVKEADGTVRGLDVFGGFMREGVLYLMGEVGHPFQRDWIDPRSTVQLAGASFPAPAQPERLLEAMYGPHWRIPDPAYKFTTPPDTVRRLNSWFRGTRVGQDEVYARGVGSTPASLEAPSGFVQWAHGLAPAAARAVDIGCGYGADALWLGRQGVPTVGLDYAPKHYRHARRTARSESLPVRFEWANLNELRSVFATAALHAAADGPRLLLARHVTDATNRKGRAALLLMARMMLAKGGQLCVQHHVRGRATTPGTTGLSMESWRRLVAEAQGRIVEEVWLDDNEQPVAESGASIQRAVITWDN